MKTKSLLSISLLIGSTIMSNIFAMEQPDKIEESKFKTDSLTPYLLLLAAHSPAKENIESPFYNIPIEMVMIILKIIRQDIIKDSNALLISIKDEIMDSGDGKAVIEQLLTNPYIDVNIQDKCGNAPLVLAVKLNNPEIIRMLLQRGANPDIQDKVGKTALIHATQNRNIEIIKILLQYGANPNIIDEDRGTALLYATHSKQIKIIEMLIAAGANESGYEVGQTNLCWAIKGDLEEVAVSLIKANLHLNIEDIKFIEDLAMKRKFKKVLDALINNFDVCILDDKIVSRQEAEQMANQLETSEKEMLII